MKVYLAESNPRIRNGLGTRLRAIPADVAEHEGVDALIAHWHADHTPADHTPAELRDDVVALIAITTATPTELADLKRLRNAGFDHTILCHAHIVDDPLRMRIANAGIDGIHETPLLGRWLAELSSRRPQLRATRVPAAIGTAALAPNTRVRDGRLVTIRSMRPEDAEREQAFVRGLSAASRRTRFFSAIRELSPTMLHDFTHPDFPRSCALIASVHEDGSDRHVAVARYAPTLPEGQDDMPASAEFAIVVADDWHGCGLAARLLRDLISAAGIAGLTRLEGLVLRDNRRMLRFARALGFTSSVDPEDHSIARIVRPLVA